MKIPRPAIIGGAVLGFGAAVAFMLPPTKPLGGPRITAATNHGFSPVNSAPPRESAPSYPSAPPPMAPADTTNEAPADPSDGGVPQDRPRSSEVAEAPVVQMPSRPAPRAANRPEPRYASADYEEDGDRAYLDREFDTGYRWAARAELQDRRQCRVLDGVRAEGCRAYLRDARDRRDDDGIF